MAQNGATAKQIKGRRCAHTDEAGNRCGRNTRSQSGLCLVHDPATERDYQAFRAMGPRSKGVPLELADAKEPKTLSELEDLLGMTTKLLLRGDIRPDRANAILKLVKYQHGLIASREDEITQQLDDERVWQAMVEHLAGKFKTTPERLMAFLEEEKNRAVQG